MNRSSARATGPISVQNSAVGRAANRAERTRSAFPTSFGRTSADSTMPKSETAASSTDAAIEASNRVTSTELTTKYAVLARSAPSMDPTSRTRGCASIPSTISAARGDARLSESLSAGVSAK